MSAFGKTFSSLPRPSSHSRRSRACLGAIVFLLTCAAHTLAAQPLQVYPTLTLKDGRQFNDVEVVNYTSGGVLVRHAQGATVFRTEVLPDEVVAALHLQSWRTADSRVAETPSRVVAQDLAGINPDIADRPAIPESALAPIAAQPAVRTSSVETREATAVLSNRPIAMPEALPASSENSAATPSGEGNMPVFFGAQNQAIGAPKSSYVNLGGRVVVKPPSGGLYLLGDVEVRAYPSNLLASYLEQAKARCDTATRKILDRANVAANEGRFDDYRTLIAQAREMSSHYLDNLPEAPFKARSDEYGNFTLRHNLSDIRLVATGSVSNAQGEWTYEWIGVAPDKEANLTEANATATSPVEMNKSKYASR